MTIPALKPLDLARSEWTAAVRSPHAHHVLASLCRLEPLLAEVGARDLAELVEALRTRGGAEARALAAARFQALLRHANLDPLVGRVLLQALLPGLVSVGRRLSWGSGGDLADAGSFFAELLATTWEVIVEWAGQDRRYAALDILSAVRCRQRRRVVKERATREVSAAGIEPGDLAGIPAVAPGTTLEDELARAIDDLPGHGLDPEEANLLYGWRVLGIPAAELMQATGRSRSELDEIRRRAAHQLCS
jgi:hypothetical protein